MFSVACPVAASVPGVIAVEESGWLVAVGLALVEESGWLAAVGLALAEELGGVVVVLMPRSSSAKPGLATQPVKARPSNEVAKIR